MEQLNYRNDIEIKLLANRRFLYANRRQSIVITAENKATEICVLFPDDYERYSKRVDFVNSQGKEWTEGLYIPEYKNYPPGYHKTRFHFTLPAEVTTEGELKMQFIAYLPDESMTTVPFEVIPVDVQSGVLAFKKNARANPDLLILSYNRSTEALFKAEQAKSKSIKAEEQSAAAFEAANSTEAAAEEAKQAAGIAESKAGEAVTAAEQAKQTAAQAVSAADAAGVKAGDAAATAGQAETTAKKAKLTAVAAKQFAQSVLDRANSGEFNGEKGEKGDKGDKGDKGTDGVLLAVDNLVGFYVDGDGGFYAYASDTSTFDFRYDDESGNLYVII